MANDFVIPRRPQGIESRIPVADKNCIEYVVAFGVKNEEGFLLFHPEYLTSDGKLSNSGKRACKDFFSYSKNKEYREAYAGYLREFMARKRDGGADVLNEIDDSRKDKVLKQLLGQAMSLVESGEGLDPDTMKTVVEVFRKLNILKDEVEEQERPRRYLPVRCRQECQYRAFCEKAIENGEIENECMHCKALVVAKEHGYIYDPTTNLNIPQDDAL